MKTKTVYEAVDGTWHDTEEAAQFHNVKDALRKDLSTLRNSGFEESCVLIDDLRDVVNAAPQVLDVLLKHLHPDLHRVGLDRLIAAAERMDREVKPDTAVLASVGFTECPHCKAPTKPYVDVTGRERCAVCVKPLEPVT